MLFIRYLYLQACAVAVRMRVFSVSFVLKRFSKRKKETEGFAFKIDNEFLASCLSACGPKQIVSARIISMKTSLLQFLVIEKRSYRIELKKMLANSHLAHEYDVF